VIQTLLAGAISRAIADAQDAGALPRFDVPEVELSRTKTPEHGDWSSQIALVAAKRAGMNPRDLANEIAARLAGVKEVSSVEVAGPGFLNFRLSHATLSGVVRDVQEAGGAWGRSVVEPRERVQVEFVSANPTGPLHLGHGRWAVVGDAVAALLEATGQAVQREFYINDFGTQMELFGRSIAARYLQALGKDAAVPDEGYQGVYVTELAKEIAAEKGEEYADLEPAAMTKTFREIGRARMLAHQKEVLERIGVRFDVWFSETDLHRNGEVAQAIELLKKHGHTYTEGGALWVRTTDFGDDKDRVAVRESGEPTYFAADIAYFLDKRARGFDRLIYLWGADHHGYVGRLRAAVRCLDEDPDKVEILIGQFVNLKRSGEPVRMSKRTGELVTFEELVEEAGPDATRYTMLRQLSIDTPLDFDVDLVVQRSQDNPVYYVQYAHARICSIIAYAQEQGVEPATIEQVSLERLEHSSELELVRRIGDLPDVVRAAARMRAPHRLTNYAEDLARLFHAFYRDCRVVTDDHGLTQARLHLCISARISLANVLALLGVGAPERM
jgi:arginyl-tRNA synthetase